MTLVKQLRTKFTLSDYHNENDKQRDRIAHKKIKLCYHTNMVSSYNI